MAERFGGAALQAYEKVFAEAEKTMSPSF